MLQRIRLHGDFIHQAKSEDQRKALKIKVKLCTSDLSECSVVYVYLEGMWAYGSLIRAPMEGLGALQNPCKVGVFYLKN